MCFRVFVIGFVAGYVVAVVVDFVVGRVVTSDVDCVVDPGRRMPELFIVKHVFVYLRSPRRRREPFVLRNHYGTYLSVPKIASPEARTNIQK